MSRAGTLETALTNAGLGFRYVDLFQEVPAGCRWIRPRG